MEEIISDYKALIKQIEKITTIINLRDLLVKIVLILLMGYIVFTFFFGVWRMNGISMVPSISDGDLIIFYRLDKQINPGDIVAFNKNGKKHFLRVVATEGQIVDITKDGELLINNHVEENESFFKTKKAESSSIEFPCKVEKGSVFVISDYRDDYDDSRSFGTIKVNDIEGKVLSILRTKNV